MNNDINTIPKGSGSPINSFGLNIRLSSESESSAVTSSDVTSVEHTINIIYLFQYGFKNNNNLNTFPLLPP